MHSGSYGWGMAAQTHMEGAAFRIKPWMQQSAARGGTMKQGSALQSEQLPSSSSLQLSLWLFEKGDGVEYLQKRHLSREGSLKAEICGQFFGEST